MYFLGKNYDKKSDVEHIKLDTSEIEMELEALGFTARVVEVNILKAFYEYYLEVAMGTDLNKLEKHDRVLALALKSPTGKVYWQIPVPGKNYIGLRVPKPSDELKHHEIMHLGKKDWRSKLATVFFSLGEANFSIARKILGTK